MPVTIPVRLLQPAEPRFDLAQPEPELTTDAEPARTAATAPEVVQRLDADVQTLYQVRGGQDGLERIVGLHVGEVRETTRDRPRQPRGPSMWPAIVW